MALHVRKLNGDATLLLTFTPSFAPKGNQNSRFPGSYTILLDPWLHGDSTIFHEKFATSRHTTPAAIESIAELQEEVDMIIVSQDKSDHLSKETMCSLPRDCRATILTTPKAAKKIREWRHFEHPDIIQELQTYNSKKDSTIFRIPLKPYSSASAEGEITVANIIQKRDLADLHNAIGITYCPPGTVFTAANGSAVKLDDMPMMSRPGSSSSPSTSSSARTPRQRYIRTSLDEGQPSRSKQLEQTKEIELSLPSPNVSARPFAKPRAASPAGRPSVSGSRRATIEATDKRPQDDEKVLSVLYTPHGTDFASLQAYVRNHLSPLHGALPVTALFHSLNYEANPWWFGGVVCAGAPGGIKVARGLDAKYWISVHDELKEVEGWGTTLLTSRPYSSQEVVKMLREADGIGGGRGMGTEVCVLGSGQEKRLVG
ncbi:Hypothetical predicted protein [Lecanosticta acicola]|uniref:Uncharacterized protein n=1 Tax=Lecanosticta acicola TaxID=111012 RepID=A0AAI8Z4H0_9PEZI|nr:Hypothetical predicted protein [Lecanosticta acicola]